MQSSAQFRLWSSDPQPLESPTESSRPSTATGACSKRSIGSVRYVNPVLDVSSRNIEDSAYELLPTFLESVQSTVSSLKSRNMTSKPASASSVSGVGFAAYVPTHISASASRSSKNAHLISLKGLRSPLKIR